MTDRAFDMPAGLSIGGYNLCYLRPEATLATVTQDEYKAPVAAAWHAGAGRVVCYTGEADGKYAGAIANWERVGDYYTSLARWVAGAVGTAGRRDAADPGGEGRHATWCSCTWTRSARASRSRRCRRR